MGANQDHFLPQLWLLDNASRTDQEDLLLLSSSVIRDIFNSNAKKLAQRKKSELQQHHERVSRIEEIKKELITVPDALTQIPDFKSGINWSIALDETAEKYTECDPEEIDSTLEKDHPGIFDIEKRKMLRSGKNTADAAEDSDWIKQRRRALIDMMDGVLEVKDDIFAVEIALPAFMNPDLAEYAREEEWDDEQTKLKQAYDKKVKLLQETRQKYKIQLISEAKKIVDQDFQAAQSFDQALHQFCIEKCNCDAEQHSLLLRKSRLGLVTKHSDVVTEEYQRVSSANEDFKLDSQETLVKNLEVLLNQLKTKVEMAQSDIQNLEKAFRKDCVPELQVQENNLQQVNSLKKQMMKNIDQRFDVIDLFGDTSMEFLLPEQVLQKILDKKENIDIDLEFLGKDNPVYDRTVEICQQQMQAVQRLTILEKLTQQCNRQYKSIKKLVNASAAQKSSIEEELEKVGQAKKDNMLSNLPIQLLLRQGIVQLEGVDLASGQEFSQCTLIERHEIEMLNEAILNIGIVIVEEMKKQIQFKQQIRMYQWELRKMAMMQEDAHQKTRDIQLFKLSKNVKEMIENSGGDKQKAIQQQIQSLEKRLIGLVFKKSSIFRPFMSLFG